MAQIQSDRLLSSISSSPTKLNTVMDALHFLVVPYALLKNLQSDEEIGALLPDSVRSAVLPRVTGMWLLSIAVISRV